MLDMIRRARPLAVALTLGIAWSAGASAPGQVRETSPGDRSKPAVPRTAWGDPDLQGMWTNIAEINVPFERPKALAHTPELTEEQARERTRIAVEQYQIDPSAFAQYVPGAPRKDPGQPTGPIGGPVEMTERSSGTSRATGRVVDPPDGRLPPLTPDALKRQAAAAEARKGRGRYDSWHDLGAWQRCITRGVPGSMLPTGYNANYQILQAPGYVAILYEMIHDARIIPLDGRPHVRENLRLWMGDARGRWEGDTLVVETTNFNEEGAAAGARDATATMRVVERFTRVDAGSIRYLATVEDPSSWMRPWTVGSTLTQGAAADRIFEYACHEGNYSLRNTLSGTRAEEAAARQ
jgi:hypothetical protein